MSSNYSQSTNILRDSSRGVDYIVTPNSKKVVDQISSDFYKGVRSFNIIGSYGTGKSSFLVSLERSLKKEERYFQSELSKFKNVETFKLVGEYASLFDVFCGHFQIKPNEKSSEMVFSELYNLYSKAGKSNSLLVIIIDEFGKFLEYAAKNDPEREIYFIQQLAEFVNDPSINVLLITSVHQNFDAYSFSLNQTQRQEWTKVKGRFKEIAFNEPVEQLLFLASEKLKKIHSGSIPKEKIKSSLALAISSKAFKINVDYSSQIAEQIFPLDLLSANSLTLTLQKYGQNERSLFSFLESETKLFASYSNSELKDFYSLADVYDYLVFNFYSFINSRYNPDFAIWTSIKNGLDRIESEFDNELDSYSRVLKAIGILNLTASYGASLGKDFLSKYSTECMGIQEADRIIENLESKKIIVYRQYNSRFNLFEGTDLDIIEALSLAENKVSETIDVVNLLKREYKFSPVLAKAHTFEKGTPRLFEYVISDDPISLEPKGEIDGFVNLIFNEGISTDEVLKISKDQEEAILYGFFQNFNSIKKQLFEIEKTQKVIEENLEDKVAVKELNNIIQHQRNLLNHYIIENLYSTHSSVVWVFKGEILNINSKRKFYQSLSKICNQIYHLAPIFKNELVNRHKFSSSIHTAKRNFLKALVISTEPELGFPKDRFPPEKTIYLSLLGENGLDPFYFDGSYEPFNLTRSSFYPLWNSCIEFLNSTKQGKKSVYQLSRILSAKPFKLKQGFIDFWIPSFLYLKRNDFALFGDGGYIPVLNDQILELVVKNSRGYSVKAFDIDGVKLHLFNSYREFLNQSATGKISNDTFIETIKPFLVFYRDLTEYSKTTTRLSKNALAVRKAIAESKEPEKTFFEDFPIALGYSISDLKSSNGLFADYITLLQDSIREIRTSQDHLYERVEDFLNTEFLDGEHPFEIYKSRLQNRFKSIKRHLCLPHQKTFLLRLDSELDDRNSWLNSLCQAIIGKPLNKILDSEEIALYDRIKNTFLELDSLTKMSNSGFDEENEDVIEIELSSFGEKKQKNIFRIPKKRADKTKLIEDNLMKALGEDKHINIHALAGLLKKLMSE